VQTKRSREKPVIYARGNKLHRLLQRCPTLVQYFPTPYVLSGFFVTIFSYWLKQLYFGLFYTRPDFIEFVAEDNGQLGYYHLHRGTPGAGAKPLIIICHGLTGYGCDTNSVWMSNILARYDYDIIGANGRTCGPDGLMLTPKFQDACSSEDLRELILHLQESGETRPIILAGLSLGTFIITQYMAKYPGTVQGAFCISCPVSHIDGIPQLDATFSGKFFDALLAFNLIRCAQTNLLKNPEFEDMFDQSQLLGRTKIWEIEEVLIPPNGYEDRFDYYRQADLMQFFPHVEEPMLIINATDDMFINPNAVYKITQCIGNDNIALCQVSTGGHVGFLHGWHCSVNWAPHVLREWVEALQQQHEII